MAKPYALRSGGSGPVFDGDAGDVLTMQSDGTAKFSPGGAGSVEPLTLEFWVDQGRAGSTQDGSIANPFLTIQNGIDAIVDSAAGAGSLMVAEGDYSTEELTCPLAITIAASTKPITIAKLGTEDSRVSIRLVNVNVTGESWLINSTHVEGGGLLGDVSCTGEPRLDGINATFGEITCLDVLGALSFRDCTVAALLGAEGGFHADELRCWDTAIVGSVEAENVFLYVSTVGDGLTAQRATLEQTTVTGGLDVANTLTADTFSLLGARKGTISPNPAPLLTNVTDHILSFGIIAVPAIEQGSFADVNVGGSGFFGKDTDVVVVTLADPQLANVGIAAAWIKANGDINIRFFGTTAGGNQTFNMALIPATP